MIKKRTFNDRLSDKLKDQQYREDYDAWELPVKISIALTRRRNELGLTQDQLAKRLGIPQQDISKVENLSGGIPKIVTLRRIAAALGCRLEFYLERELPLEREVQAFDDKDAVLDEGSWLIQVRRSYAKARTRDKELVFAGAVL